MTIADIPSADFKDKENIVVIGGGLVGCEAALGLAMKGHNVTLLEMRDDIAIDLNIINKVSLMNELKKYNVNIVTGIRCNEIKDGKLIGTDKDGKTVEYSFDKAIAATGTRRINEIVDAVEREFPETYVIGDCVNIGKIADAVHKGFIVGTQI